MVAGFAGSALVLEGSVVAELVVVEVDGSEDPSSVEERAGSTGECSSSSRGTEKPSSYKSM